VVQVAPICRVVSRFTVFGHAGLNRVRFPRRTGLVTLDAGTYRISGRTSNDRRLVERAIVVVVQRGHPTSAQLEAARAANVCSGAPSLAPLGSAFTFAQIERASSPPGRPSANGPALAPDSIPGGVLGSTAAKAARAIRPMLVALLALAIVLLGIASLPKLTFVDQRANELLARHRLEIAGLGAAAFIAVVISFLLE